MRSIAHCHGGYGCRDEHHDDTHAELLVHGGNREALLEECLRSAIGLVAPIHLSNPGIRRFTGVVGKTSDLPWAVEIDPEFEIEIGPADGLRVDRTQSRHRKNQRMETRHLDGSHRPMMRVEDHAYRTGIVVDDTWMAMVDGPDDTCRSGRWYFSISSIAVHLAAGNESYDVIIDDLYFSYPLSKPGKEACNSAQDSEIRKNLLLPLGFSLVELSLGKSSRR